MKYLIAVFLVYTLLFPAFHGYAQPDSTTASKTELDQLTLIESYNLALEHSEKIAISREEIERAEVSFLEASGIAIGDVSFVATNLRQDARQERGGASSDSSVESTSTKRVRNEEKFVVSQPLFQGFKSLGALMGAGNLRDQREHEWIRAQHLLFLDVARSFYQVLRYEKDLETIQEIKKLLDDRISELDQREKIGRSRTSELATANARLKNIEAELARSKGAYLAEKNIFEFLLGISIDGVKLVDTPLPDEKGSIDDYLIRLDMRPDVEASENAMKIAKKNIIVSQSDLWPLISMDLNRYTQREGFQSNIDWDILFKIDVPLFRGGETIALIKDAISNWRQAKLAYSLTKREAQLDIKQTYQDWVTSNERYKALRDSVYASEENFRLQKEDYTRNLVNNLDVLEALEILYQSSRQANEVYYESKLNHWRLQVASGQCCAESL